MPHSGLKLIMLSANTQGLKAKYLDMFHCENFKFVTILGEFKEHWIALQPTDSWKTISR